jgi:hypothetical protein
MVSSKLFGERGMSVYEPAVRTRTLARIVGPYLVLMAIVLFARQDTLPSLLSAFMQDAPLVLATGAFTLMAGLAMIAAHHHWSSAAAVVISLIGIAAALKGASLMIAPELGTEMTAAVVQTPAALVIAAGVELLIGLWLSFVGWLSKP